ncbi:MAG TPA: DUF3667 domain-containing protein [Gemmatimonadaceae bacterium]|nr:DUF3667 domain-containing protein [Gemmatimonadaceae bacterium]
MTEPRGDACLNCGAPLVGHFCGECGQRDIPPYPGVRELTLDAISELSGWDGRFSSTVRTLVRRPGMLTREFLEGRRARYTSPVRLYLSASVAYFLLAAAAPNVRIGDTVTGVNVSATTTGSAPEDSRASRVGSVATAALESGEALSETERAATLAEIERAPPVMRPFLRRVVLDPGGFRRGIVETMPRMLFVLLPLFAGIVALFYRGRKYPEHLYFAIHLHTFLFLALGVTALMRFTQVPALVAMAGLVAAIWIPIYAILAYRRVYGDSLGRTLAKGAAIGAIYAVTSAVAFTVMIYWVSVAG